MLIHELQEYTDSIHKKLQHLERKFELSAAGTKNSDKLIIINRNIKQIRSDMEKLDLGELRWQDLEKYGIRQHSLEKNSQQETQKNDQVFGIQSFTLLSSIEIKTLCPGASEFVNDLYSIINYMSANYLMIFTQKIFISSNRIQSRREKMYMQYQELMRVFDDYSHLQIQINRASSADLETLVYREYVSIVTKILTFLNDILNAINDIRDGSSFTNADLQRSIESTDKTTTLHGLPINIVLEECVNFVQETFEYIRFKDRDLIDSINLKKKS